MRSILVPQHAPFVQLTILLCLCISVERWGLSFLVSYETFVYFTPSRATQAVSVLTHIRCTPPLLAFYGIPNRRVVCVVILCTEKSLGAPQSCADFRDNQLMRAQRFHRLGVRHAQFGHAARPLCGVP